MTRLTGSAPESGEPGGDENRVILRGMDATAQHIAIVSLERILAAETWVAGQLQSDFDCTDRIAGGNIFDVVRLDAAWNIARIESGGRRLDQHSIGVEQCLDFAELLLHARERGQCRAEITRRTGLQVIAQPITCSLSHTVIDR